ncbi:unnamed protein product [Rotaria sp. Silwood1]|nr:unnamed protein product [Rotaria sp. Silwood1]
MTGAPNTLYKEEVYTAYKREVLDILVGDLFVVLELQKNTEDSHRSMTKYNPQDKYSVAFDYLSPYKIEWIPSEDHLGAIDDRLGYSKWKRCLDHIEKAEKNNDMKYKFIVRTRPDLYFAKPLPSPEKLPNDRILINPYYECLYDIPSGYNESWTKNLTLCSLHDRGLSHLFAIVPRDLADRYMRVGYTANLPLQVCGGRAMDPECLIKAMLIKANVTFEMWPFIVKILHSSKSCQNPSWNQFDSWC